MTERTWEQCTKGSCHHHGRCMYLNHPMCPLPNDAERALAEHGLASGPSTEHPTDAMRKAADEGLLELGHDPVSDEALNIIYLAMEATRTPSTPNEEGVVCGQDIAPVGWWCSRAVGHDGPCAAHEKVTANPLVIAEGALRTARHAILRQCDAFKAEGEITTALWHIRAALKPPTPAIDESKLKLKPARPVVLEDDTGAYPAIDDEGLDTIREVAERLSIEAQLSLPPAEQRLQAKMGDCARTLFAALKAIQG